MKIKTFLAALLIYVASVLPSLALTQSSVQAAKAPAPDSKQIAATRTSKKAVNRKKRVTSKTTSSKRAKAAKRTKKHRAKSKSTFKPNDKTALKAPAKIASKKAAKNKLTAIELKAIEERTPVDDDPISVELTAAELEIAKQVFVGDIPCELDTIVHITPHEREGFFIVRAGIQRFRMQPVASRTGAVRLEDPRAGAMWLQLGNKSMLMSQKIGRRLADECVAPAQAAVKEALKKNPLPSLLEPLPVNRAEPVRSNQATNSASAETTFNGSGAVLTTQVPTAGAQKAAEQGAATPNDQAQAAAPAGAASK